MTAKKTDDKAAAAKDDKTAAKDDSKDVTTTEKIDKGEGPSDKVETVETDKDAAGKGDTRGAVVYGDTGLENEKDLAPKGDGVLGKVREGDKEVPWSYVTGADFEDEPKVRTSDSNDPARTWTVQDLAEDGETAVALVPVEAEPGQTFRVSELPNVDSMKNAGIDPVQWLSGLPVRADVK